MLCFPIVYQQLFMNQQQLLDVEEAMLIVGKCLLCHFPLVSPGQVMTAFRLK
jgi:hypothetical protein